MLYIVRGVGRENVDELPGTCEVVACNIAKNKTFA